MNRSADTPQPKAEWRILPFEVAAVPQSDRGKRVKQRDYLPAGRIPVIDQGQAQLGGYTNNEEFAFVGDLPVVLFGDHTRAVKFVDHPFAVGADGIKIFRPGDGIRPKYLYYWMKSARLPDRGYGRHYQFLRQLTVPAPPPAEQYEIVAEIEKQLSRLDEAVANLKRVKANLKRYKAAILKAAVEGRLVPTENELARREGRSYETGAQLLQRILEIRRSQWRGKAKYRESSASDRSAVDVLPDGWAWSSLDALLREPLRNGHSAKATDEPSGLRAFTLSAVTEGDFSEANTKRTVALAERVADLWAQPGDIYVERSNTPELVGTACLYRGPANYAFIPDLLIRVRVCEWLLPAYVEIALQK